MSDSSSASGSRPGLAGSTTLRLPGSDGALHPHTFREPPAWPRPAAAPTCRTAYAAAHVVADPLADNTPGAPARLDWDATLAFRRHLWSYGFGVAEAMDTAQRGIGLDHDAARELIRRSAAEARACGGAIAAGVATDQLPTPPSDLATVASAYREQIEEVVEAGATPVVMASRHLARLARHPGDYQEVYGRVLAHAPRPVILHWLGAMFDPALAGYWGSHDIDEATGHVLAIVQEHAQRIDGIKVSLLDERHEQALRAALPGGVKLYTGDDFHYPELIAGDGRHYSDALLGVFDPIAPVAAAALQALEVGDVERYHALLRPTVPLARHLFSAPTYHYKAGIVFVAWLAGHQDGLVMVAGAQSGRSVVHLVQAARLAGDAGLLPDPELAARRLRAFLETAGVAA